MSCERGRTGETRRELLRAAREVFTERGFAEAGVDDIVARAGSSVGSLYHHFGGKTDLYLALWEYHQGAHEERAGRAVAQARAAGMDGPLDLFVTGARAFLDGTWERRDLARLFLDGDKPPGFLLLRRRRNRGWLRRNAVLLGAGPDPIDRLGVSCLTALIGEVGREVSRCDSHEEVEAIIDAAVILIRRFAPLFSEPE